MRPVSWWWHTAEKSCIVAKIMRVVNGNDASAAVFAEKTSRPQICSSCSLFWNVSDEGVTRGYPLLHVSINPGAPGTPLGHQVAEQPNRRIRSNQTDVSDVSDGKIKITILILRWGPCLPETPFGQQVVEQPVYTLVVWWPNAHLVAFSCNFWLCLGLPYWWEKAKMMLGRHHLSPSNCFLVGFFPLVLTYWAIARFLKPHFTAIQSGQRGSFSAWGLFVIISTSFKLLLPQNCEIPQLPI